jgi:hypothetical protein
MAQQTKITREGREYCLYTRDTGEWALCSVSGGSLYARWATRPTADQISETIAKYRRAIEGSKQFFETVED